MASAKRFPTIQISIAPSGPSPALSANQFENTSLPSALRAAQLICPVKGPRKEN
jgi:hypothetical protein